MDLDGWANSIGRRFSDSSLGECVRWALGAARGNADAKFRMKFAESAAQARQQELELA